MTNTIKKIIGGITIVEKVFGGLCFAILALLMAMDVGSREIFNEGIEWAQKGAIILMIWGGFIGAALTTAKGGHLRPEIADKLWPEKFKPFLKVIEHLIVTGFCVFLFYLSLEHLQAVQANGDIHPVIVGLPLWVVNIIFPYVFVSMAFRHFVFAIVPSLRPDDYGETSKVLDEFEKEEVGY
ncbi:TRAP transporter small permease [Leptospira sp. GIMC2001]|uniref:TRAP transporter small permease n=1 Tax=Leptospira sp. GIMC2001 TaxID=1513297 RepID=UPI00234B1A44|nr:TRAP transporter small permease [Leptospira sp. GIMC2001]WCL49904.1 TRAP transporter small permease [Leptospira sp. GIMC2001]